MRNPLKLLAITCFFSLSASAQTTSANHLLWRISGNGLTKPSYLFGTMHLTDKRLFYFGDSLYRALEQTEGFAAEIDFNAFLNKYFDKLIGQGGLRALVKDKVNASVLDRNKEKLEKKFNKPAEEITVNDLKEEESARHARLLKSGEMETFMDAYLLGLADKQGKWIGGIEDPEDQLDLDDAFDTETRINSILEEEKADEGRKTLEWMMQTYLEENMESIDRSSELWKGAKDIILIRRNVKMAYRVDSLANIRTCFFAVGAAHLPGDSGVVQLLRNRGYSVTPVISSRKIAPEKYKYKEVKREWVKVWAKDSLYSVMMPMQPLPIPALSDSPYDMLFYYDIVSNVGYFTFNIPAISNIKPDSVIANLAKVYKTQATSFTKKNISWNGMVGAEFQMEMDEAYLRMQIFVPGNYMSLNMVASINKPGLASVNATRFLESFRPDTVRAAQAMAKMKAMGVQQFDYKDDGFSIQSPVKLKRSRVETGPDNPWNRIKFEGYSPVTQSYYIITKDATNPGYYSNQDSAYFRQMEDNYTQSTGAKIISSATTTVEGYPAHEILMKLEKDGAQLAIKFLLINKGNHRYTIFKTYDANRTESDDPVFKSFRFLPLAPVEWKSINESGFTTFAPGNIEKNDTSEYRRIIYTMYDSSVATTFTVTKEVLPENYWTANDSTLFEERIRTFYNKNDSVISKKKFVNGDIKGVDLIIKLNDSHLVKRMKLVQQADTLYTLYSFLAPDLLRSGPNNRFFMDFKPVHATGETTIFTSKAKRLLADLQTTDSAAFAKANQSLWNAAFKHADLPLLQEAMLNVYHDRDTSDNIYVSGTVNAQLQRIITKLDTAGVSLSFVKNNYRQLAGKRAFIRPLLLNILSEQHTAASYDLLRQYLSELKPTDLHYTYLHGLTDSLSLSKQLFPDAFSALENEQFSSQLANLAVQLLDSGYINMSSVVAHKSAIFKAASRMFDENKEELSEGGGYQYLSILELLTRLKSAEGNALLRKASGLASLEVCEASLMGLMRNGEKVTQAELLPLAKSDMYRLTLYDSLDKKGKLLLFPPAYLSQKLLGQSRIYTGASDDETPEISFIKENVIDYKGSKKKFYLYKVSFGEGEESSSYLGIAGPYSLNVKDLKTDNAATGMYWKEEYDEKNIETQFTAWLKQLVEQEEEE